MRVKAAKPTQNNHFIYGYHAVHSVMQHKPDLIHDLYLEASDKYQDLIDLAERLAINIICDKKRFAALTQPQEEKVHQGIMALCQPIREQDINDLEALVNHSGHPLKLLALDGVTDPHNLGACLRNAAAFAVDALIIPKDHSVKLNDTVIKVACGAAHLVPVMKVTNLVRTLDWLKTMNIMLLGTSERAALPIHAYKKPADTSIVLVMGSEGKGLRHLTAKTCDQLLRIHLPGIIQSLNVSAATAVCLHELFGKS